MWLWYLLIDEHITGVVEGEVFGQVGNIKRIRQRERKSLRVRRNRARKREGVVRNIFVFIDITQFGGLQNVLNKENGRGTDIVRT